MLETIYPNLRFFYLRSFAHICVRFAEICVRFARFKLQEILSYIKKDESQESNRDFMEINHTLCKHPAAKISFI